MGTKKRKRTSYSKDSTFNAVFILTFVMIVSFVQSLREGQWWAILIVVLMVIAIGVVIFLYFMKKKKKSTKHLSVAFRKVLTKTPEELELYVVDLFNAMGYRAKHTGRTGDNGVDVVAEINEMRYAIQVKKYTGNVPFNAVQQVNTGKDLYDCHEACIVTTAPGFTRSARANAKNFALN